MAQIKKTTAKPKPKKVRTPKRTTERRPTVKHTKKKERSQSLVIEFYKNVFTHMTMPVSENFINRVAMDLMEWAANDDGAFRLTQFIRKIGMHHKTFYRWCDKYPNLMEAKECALMAIGDRREIGALKNELNARVVMFRQHIYEPSWADSEAMREELKARNLHSTDKDIKYTICLEDYSIDPGEEPTDNLPKD